MVREHMKVIDDMIERRFGFGRVPTKCRIRSYYNHPNL